MNLRELLDDQTVPDLMLQGLSEHTADVQNGDAFIALSEPLASWQQHVNQAVAAGAQVVLHDRSDLTQATAVSSVRVADLAQRRGELAARFYQHPSEQLTCMGVTGTNGKTSIAYHFADLSGRLAKPCGYGGTLGWGALNHLDVAGGLTTSNAVALQRNLAGLVEQGMVRAALEVSSHALAQDRAAQVKFQHAVFTNLTRDHLDYHGSVAAYGAAKAKLFTEWSLQTAVINADDGFGQSLLHRAQAERILSYGQQADVRWSSHPSANGCVVKWTTPWGQAEVEVPVAAEFAVANLTAVLSLLLLLDHPLDDIAAAMVEVRQVPGRMEMIDHQAHQPAVVVDFAHTPDALGKVLAALRPRCQGELICVVGCGGDRDVGKRPMMAAAAEKGADLVWLTSDNPRSEDPADIIEQMRSGTSNGSVWECVDREEAIRRAIAEAETQDIVLIAGKGHEDYQEVAGQRLPFDDREVARDALREIA